MSSPAVPTALTDLVQATAAGHTADPSQLEAISRWRLACGDGRGAARWHRWSLEPPHANALRQPLEELALLLGQPQLAAQLGTTHGWGAVLLALNNGDPGEALERQQAAIAAEAVIEADLGLRLAGMWQRHGQAEPALALLQAIAAQAATPALCNAIAHLHEQQQQPAAAAPWWDHSLSLDPSQPAVLMQRSRNALALEDPALAFHLAQALHERDRTHAVALELRVEALQQLGATASLRLALAPLVRQGRERYQQQARALDRWWRPRRRRQQQWRHQLTEPLQRLPLQLLQPPRPLLSPSLAPCRSIGVLGSRDGLELAGLLAAADQPGVVWNLASREPLLSARNLQQLLPAGWQLRRWPRWQPELHGPLEALVIADRRLPTPPQAPDQVLRAECPA